MTISKMPKKITRCVLIHHELVRKTIQEEGWPVTYSDIDYHLDLYCSEMEQKGKWQVDQTHIKPIHNDAYAWLSKEYILEQAWQEYCEHGEAIAEEIEWLNNIQKKPIKPSRKQYNKPKPLPDIEKHFWKNCWESIKRRFTDG